MSGATIQDWTEHGVPLTFDEYRDVRYRVYRASERHFLDVCDADGEPIHTLELPEGMKLGASSYEVLLRYVLLDVVAAA